MKIKKEYIILAALIVALSAYLLVQKSDKTHYQLPVLEDLSQTEITGIEIQTGNSAIKLKLEDNNWVIEPDNFPAVQSKVESMISTIKDLKLTALVSESKNYARYDLNDDKKIAITARSDGKVARQFDMGKTASSYRHTFVKIEGNPKVYHAAANFRNRFTGSTADMTDKKVLQFTPAAITQLSVNSNTKKLALKKETQPAEDKKPEDKPAEPKEIWKTDKGEVKKSDAVNGFLGTFSSLTCDNYIKGVKKEELKEPLHTFTVNGPKEYTLSIYPAKGEAKEFTAVSSEREHPFVLSGEAVEKMTEKLNEL